LPDSSEKLNIRFRAILGRKVKLKRHGSEQKQREATADSDFHDAPWN
jgi:hypothetical protein